jgi:SpoIIAA-like
MIDVLESPDRVAAFAVSGTLTGQDYDRIIAEVEAKLARHERIGIVLDLTQFHDLTAEAAWKDFRYDLSKLLELKRFPREAIVSDKRWMQIAAQIADPILPYVDVRVFAARSDALEWAAGF